MNKNQELATRLSLTGHELLNRCSTVGPQWVFLSRIANGLLVFGLVLVVPLVVEVAPPSKQYPVALTLKPASERPLLLLTASGEPFARRGECVAEPVTLSHLPPYLIDAVIAMEDRRFYDHFGIDPQGVLRAAWTNYNAGGIVQGGSTITQQLAKMTYLSNKRTFARKQEEAVIALWLEIALTKDQILERYLSSAYFGQGCYGVRAAARHYFDKPVEDLTLGESALLVALLKSPSTLSENRQDAQDRAKLVLQAMVNDGRLDQSRLAGVVMPQRHESGDENELGSYYADWIAESVHPADPTERKVLPVQTAFEPELQRLADEAVTSVLAKEGKARSASQAAMVIMRTDGRVVAMVGGKSYEDSQFNRATHGLRQPGSAFKLFVYLTALKAGASTDMTVVDEPISIGNYTPTNFGNRYRGAVSLERAFASSINTVAVRLCESVGRNNVIDTARDLGITTPLAPTPSIALGSYEVNLLELTSAYAAVAAGAYPIKPWAILNEGSVTHAPTLPPAGAGRWRLGVADDMRYLLSATVQHGSGRAARLPIPAFGKTGTSQDFRDAWFIGFAGNLVVGVWVGNDDSSPMKRVTGGSLPAEIWHAFMNRALESDPHFQRSLPQIVAFQAREKPGSELTDVADLGLNNGARAAGYEKRRNSSDDRSFGRSTYPYLLGRPETSPPPRERAGWSGGGREPSFQHRLSQIPGWPGQ